MKFLFATGNKHKVYEANEVGVKYGVKFAQIKCPYPEKRSESISEVAREGVEFVHSKIRKPVIVEDSGLFIEALHGFPGAYSAYAFEKIGNTGVLKLLSGLRDRKAEFKSCVAYHTGREVRLFEGSVIGKIAYELRGSCGFGFDPIFIPEGFSKTFAEDRKLKSQVSHRERAFEEFLRVCR